MLIDTEGDGVTGTETPTDPSYLNLPQPSQFAFFVDLLVKEDGIADCWRMVDRKSILPISFIVDVAGVGFGVRS